MPALHAAPQNRNMQLRNWSWPQLTRRSGHRAGLDLSNWGFCCTAAAMLLCCALCTSIDYGSRPRERRTAAMLQTWSSSGPQLLQLHSSIGSVDMEAGLMTLDMHLVQKQAAADDDYCSHLGSGGPQLLIGSTAAPTAQVVLPLCQLPPEHSFSAVLPLQQQRSQPQPFDQHVAEVRVQLAAASAVGEGAPAPDKPAAAAAAGVVAPAASGSGSGLRLSGSLPAVVWSAVWAVPGLQVSVQRQTQSLQARLLGAVAAASGHNDDGGWGSSLLDQLVLPATAAADGASAATYQVRLSRCWWLRVIHLTAAVMQVLAVAGCCLLLLGQCLCSYLMQRLLLCSRVHGSWA